MRSQACSNTNVSSVGSMFVSRTWLNNLPKQERGSRLLRWLSRRRGRRLIRLRTSLGIRRRWRKRAGWSGYSDGEESDRLRRLTIDDSCWDTWCSTYRETSGLHITTCRLEGNIIPCCSILALYLALSAPIFPELRPIPSQPPHARTPEENQRSKKAQSFLPNSVVRSQEEKMAESDNDSGGHSNSNASSREQDRFLPIANVSRIMKKALPANAKISKDAKETVQECVSEFISFVTGEASDKCQREKRKTINGDDLLWAMTTLGFEEYVEPLKVYLAKYREMEGEKTSVGGTKEGGGSSSGSAVTSGGGFNGGPVVGGGIYGGPVMGYHHGGQMYSAAGGGGSGGFQHIGGVGVGGVVGKGSLGNAGSSGSYGGGGGGSSGGGASTGRPR
ncbi:Nuclear transcription factor Y subunit B-3 [Sesamum alatum]|uniref:Nuclear transcription factor Y subunit B-3 n=1 Tax=Sesamum alatum TaxID=300844 RepID=A0AAE1YZN8_9LAMI|nr:Nuclear transcription factor Y subunit B-3 [Sesamum alatum]